MWLHTHLLQPQALKQSPAFGANCLHHTLLFHQNTHSRKPCSTKALIGFYLTPISITFLNESCITYTVLQQIWQFGAKEEIHHLEWQMHMMNANLKQVTNNKDISSIHHQDFLVLICVSKRQHSDLLRTSFYNDKGKKEFKGISENSLVSEDRLLQSTPVANSILRWIFPNTCLENHFIILSIS